MTIPRCRKDQMPHRATKGEGLVSDTSFCLLHDLANTFLDFVVVIIITIILAVQHGEASIPRCCRSPLTLAAGAGLRGEKTDERNTGEAMDVR